MDATVAKKMISIRLDERLIRMLDKIKKKPGTMYYDRDRTWLIEHALKEQYSEFENHTTNGGQQPN